MTRKKGENFDLIRKIVWSFKKHSNEPFDDLFQEGYIGYMRAVNTYNSSKGAFSTHAWHCISSDIKDYLIKMNRKNQLLDRKDDVESLNIISNPNQFLDCLPKESRDIAEIIFRNPTPFVVRNPSEAKNRLMDILMNNEEWTMEKIYFGLVHLHNACK